MHAEQVCNHGLRLMLRGETHRLAEYQDELSRYGQAFTDRGNMAGAVFIYVLYRWGDPSAAYSRATHARMLHACPILLYRLACMLTPWMPRANASGDEMGLPFGSRVSLGDSRVEGDLSMCCVRMCGMHGTCSGVCHGCRMSEHILPKEMLRLEGIYLQAFEKLHGLLEDSGWQLKSEPKEGEELELDEEPSEEQLGLSGYMG